MKELGDLTNDKILKNLCEIILTTIDYYSKERRSVYPCAIKKHICLIFAEINISKYDEAESLLISNGLLCKINGVYTIPKIVKREYTYLFQQKTKDI